MVWALTSQPQYSSSIPAVHWYQFSFTKNRRTRCMWRLSLRQIASTSQYVWIINLINKYFICIWTTCLSVYLSMCPLVYFCVRLVSSRLPVYMSTCVSIYHPNCLPVYLFTSLFVICVCKLIIKLVMIISAHQM